MDALGVEPFETEDERQNVNFIVWSKFVLKPKQLTESTTNLDTALIMQESSPELVQKIMQ